MEDINAKIAAHINAAGTKFGHVVFVKKDKTIRRLTFQLGAMPPRVKGTQPEITATRKANNPDNKTVWCVKARDFRSVNLNNVLTVKAGGVLTRYRELK